MHPGDVVYMSFYVDNDILCYNRWGNLSRMVNKLFKEIIGRNMESYVDDVLGKSVK